MPALPLTIEQLAEATELKKLFAAWQRQRKDSGLPSSQEAAAELLGFGQSALAQYLNGKIPLNVDVSIKFSNLLGVSLADFTPSLADQAARVAGSIMDTKVGNGGYLQATFNHLHGKNIPSAIGWLPKNIEAMIQLDLISEREAALIHRFRISSDFGRDAIETTAENAERDPLSIVNDQANRKL